MGVPGPAGVDPYHTIDLFAVPEHEIFLAAETRPISGAIFYLCTGKMDSELNVFHGLLGSWVIVGLSSMELIFHVYHPTVGGGISPALFN